MLRKLAPGLVVLLVALAPLAAPLPVRAQAWSVQADALTAFDMTAARQGLSLKLNGQDISGYSLGFGTPYHVGFSLDHFEGTFKLGSDSGDGPKALTMGVDILNVFVDIPLPVLTFSVGAGWGAGNFDPNGNKSTKMDGTVVRGNLSALNLWQWMAQLGVPVYGGWEVHVSYREFRGGFRSSEKRTLAGVTERESFEFDVTGQASTLGVRYTF